MHVQEGSAALNCDTTYGGVNLNRNWSYDFGEGTGQMECDIGGYRGASAFSEPETKVLS